VAASKGTPVSIGECERKHKSTRFILTSIIALAGFFVVIAVWSVRMSSSAADGVQGCRTEMLIYSAKRAEVDKRIERDLAEVKMTLKEQNRMIEDLWRNGGHKGGNAN